MLQAVLCISSVFSKNKTERVSYTFFQNFTSPDLCRCEFIARQHKTFFYTKSVLLKHSNKIVFDQCGLLL